MSKTGKTIFILIIAVIVIGFIWWILTMQPSPSPAGAPNPAATQQGAAASVPSQTANAVPAAAGESSSAVTTSSSVDSDLNSIDSQMNGLNSDSSNVDQSLQTSNP